VNGNDGNGELPGRRRRRGARDAGADAGGADVLLRPGESDPNAVLVARRRRVDRRCSSLPVAACRQGSALAMVEASELASALHRSGSDHGATFANFERRLASLVRGKQDAAVGLGAAFAPRNRGQLLLRNAVMRMMTLPSVSRSVMRRSLRDPIQLSPLPTD
jgi:hypothetical protein